MICVHVVAREAKPAWMFNLYPCDTEPLTAVAERRRGKKGTLYHECRERAQRIRNDTLVARRIRGGLAPALQHAWGGSVD